MMTRRRTCVCSKTQPYLRHLVLSGYTKLICHLDLRGLQFLDLGDGQGWATPSALINILQHLRELHTINIECVFIASDRIVTHKELTPAHFPNLRRLQLHDVSTSLVYFMSQICAPTLDELGIKALCSRSHEPKVIEDITSARIVTSFLRRQAETLNHITISEEEWDGQNSVDLTISHRNAHMAGQSTSKVHSLLRVRVVLQPFRTPAPQMTFDLLALISGLQLRITEASLKQWSVLTTQMWLNVFRSSWITIRNLEITGQIKGLILAMTSHIDGISREGAYFMCELENLKFIGCNFRAS
jgi:hypothetical protein